MSELSILVFQPARNSDAIAMGLVTCVTRDPIFIPFFEHSFDKTLQTPTPVFSLNQRLKYLIQTFVFTPGVRLNEINQYFSVTTQLRHLVVRVRVRHE